MLYTFFGASIYCVLLISTVILVCSEKDSERTPTRCEVCKYLSSELNERLSESGKTHDVLNLGHRIDGGKQRTKKYKESETRLIEALDDPPVCDEILKYNVHAEREGSLRYAKGVSETMQTLHGLRDKGVKVELGIPYEMWDSPHAEITDMKRQCESMKEEYEEVIEDWYFHHQDKPLVSHLCEGNVLEAVQTGCLSEVFDPSKANTKGDTGDDNDAKKKKTKKGSKKKTKTKREKPVAHDVHDDL